ncbi:MAG: DNA topoisomerase I [Candidatus Bathyarchaeia archaeon]
MKQLIHNGVLVPKYEAKGFHILAKGKRIALTPAQEEMAVAWVKKLGTEYVKDSVFVRNFFRDFCKALGINEKLSPEDFDFSEIIAYVDKERAYKQNLSKEEKKRLAAERKALREANREKYGYAYVDGVKTEISNYMAEPSCIFMGRGKHPLRGKWKQGPTESDIILNLSPDAPVPPGNWKEIVWQPDSMWIAKWDDKLRGKEKYVWLSDASHPKQMNDIKKFDKAWELATRIDELRKHIETNLYAKDVLRRKVATVAYLIDALKLRVGDEKDKDEADTVGATTLRPEHIKIGTDGKVIFDFLGKDCVRWRKEAVFPDVVVGNLEEFIKNAHSTIFDGVRSRNVTLFLSEVMEGLTAKVFRTYHASKVVKESLEKANVPQHVPDFVKKHVALMANLTAAIVCNHKRKPPKNWRESLAKKRERLEKLRASAQTKKRREAIKILQLKIKEMKATKDYNLRTSLKSYIDPRIYYRWGQKVNFDWKLYYPKTLQKKFSWVENPNYDNPKINF